MLNPTFKTDLKTKATNFPPSTKNEQQIKDTETRCLLKLNKTQALPII